MHGVIMQYFAATFASRLLFNECLIIGHTRSNRMPHVGEHQLMYHVTYSTPNPNDVINPVPVYLSSQHLPFAQYISAD